MSRALESERSAGLSLIPVVITGVYYLLPSDAQKLRALQFLPQVSAYIGLALWMYRNTDAVARLGLGSRKIREGLRWGLWMGLSLGLLNVSVMWWVVPWLGRDIEFLRETPHAHVPTFVMLPWFIFFIAVAVELNFRGFLLGRMRAFFQPRFGRHTKMAAALAAAISSLAFSFDPFMVSTFKHLHWIALWDGIIWSMIWLRTNNLYATITAHAVEVIVMYSILKMTLGY